MAADPPILRTGRGRILLVDDDAAFLEAGIALVERLGYQVVGVDNGFDAIRHLSEAARQFDLAIIDIIMPGMDGRELCGHIRRLAPRTPILLSTGYSHSVDFADVLVAGQSDIIAKPYTAEALSQKIGRLIRPPVERSSPARAEAS